MRSTCHKVADTGWIPMHSTTKWLGQHCLNVAEYLNDKTPLCAPNILRWIVLHAILVFVFESKTFVIYLQELSVNVSEQQCCMSGSISTYCQVTGMLGPLANAQTVSRSISTPAAVSWSFFLS
jgi:hypothetical protein